MRERPELYPFVTLERMAEDDDKRIRFVTQWSDAAPEQYRPFKAMVVFLLNNKMDSIVAIETVVFHEDVSVAIMEPKPYYPGTDLGQIAREAIAMIGSAEAQFGMEQMIQPNPLAYLEIMLNRGIPAVTESPLKVRDGSVIRNSPSGISTAAKIAESAPGGYTRDGEAYRIACPCPAHEGDDRNLKIWDEDGRLGAFCWSHNCEYKDIMAALGVSGER